MTHKHSPVFGHGTLTCTLQLFIEITMELTGEQLRKAEMQLKRYLPQSITVYGCLVQMNRAHLVRPDPVKVFVDRWPEFSVMICRPDTEQTGVSFRQTYVFANDEVILEETLRKPSVIDWTSDPRIAINLHASDIFKSVASENNLTSNKLDMCHVMILEDVSNLPSIDSSGVSLSSLDESHTDLVNQTWKFSNNRTVGMIRNLLRSFPSCCVLDTEGKPVSWILTYISCALGMLYTVPEHRGKGYAKVLVSAMAKRFHSEGFPVYCFVGEENEISYRLMKNLGFVEDPSFRLTWIGFSNV